MNNVLFHLADRAHTHVRLARELIEENESLEASSSEARVDELEKTCASLEAQVKEQSNSIAEGEKQIMSLVAEKSQLKERHRKM